MTHGGKTQGDTTQGSGAIEDILPLTGLQEAIVYHSTAAGASDSADPYLIIAELDLDPLVGHVDVDRLRDAVRAVTARHAMLRTSYTRRRTGAPVARVHTDVPPDFTEIELSGTDELDDLRRRERGRGIDLTQPGPVRWTLARHHGSEATTLVVLAHHVALDGWSIHQVLAEVIAAYRGEQLAPVSPIRDFLQWLSARESDTAIWLDVLDGVAPTPVPTDDSASESQVVIRTLGLERSTALRALATRSGATLNTVIQLAWARVLGDLHDCDDVLFGAVVSGRHPALDGVDEMVGMLINTIPVRITLDPAESARAALTRIQRDQLRLIDHHHTPLADIVAARRSGELFNSITVFESFPRGGVRPRMFDDNTSAATLLVEDDPDVTLVLECRGADRTLIDKVIEELDALVEYPDEPLARRHRTTPVGLQGPQIGAVPPVAEQILTMAQNRRRHTAIVDGQRHLGYRELRSRTEALADSLRRRGIGPESIVALELGRRAEMVLAVLAVLRTGAAYLPIDPSYPDERRAFMRSDAAPDLLLTDADLDDLLAESAVAQDDHDENATTAVSHPDSVAYLIYTSGSTGTPKGVVGTQSALANRIAWAAQYWTGGTVLAKSSIAFIDGTTEILGALAAGATVVLADDQSARDAGLLAEIVASHGVDQITAVPALAQAIHDAMITDSAPSPRLERWIVSGEPLPAPIADVLAAGAELVNSYGSSEVAGDVAAGTIERHHQNQSNVHVGTPVPGTGIALLDRHLNPVADGSPGEVYVTGVQLGRGYLRRSGLTATAFVADPAGSGTRMYRTGDRGVRRADGRLVLLGRRDGQVKIRGHRVELAEVESAVLAVPGVLGAAVVARADADGNSRLDGYLVGQTTPEHVVEHLRESLPAAMIPGQWQVLDALPLTPGGKLDRRALPVTDDRHRAPRRAPETDVERLVTDTVADVLDLDPTGPDAPGLDDNFFDLGGHSLSATRMLTRLRIGTGRRLTVADVFDHPQLTEIAALLSDSTDNEAAAPNVAAPADEPVALVDRPDPIPLSPAQRSLYFQAGIDDSAYTVPFAVRLEASDPSTVVSAQQLAAALQIVVDRHETLRTRIVDGAQVVDPPAQRVIEVGTHVTDTIETTIRELIARPFDLAADHPIRAYLIAGTPDAGTTLLITIHHIAADEWSATTLFAELAAAYNGNPLPELPIQFVDHTIWQLERLGSPTDASSLAHQELEFWRETLAGSPEELDLPYDRRRGDHRDHRGDQVEIVIGADRLEALTALTRGESATMFIAVHAAVAIALAASGAGADIVVGTPTAGRTSTAAESLIGMFVNTLALRTDLGGNPTLREVISRVRTTDVTAYAHAEVPFDSVVAALAPARSLARHPIFQTMVQYRDAIVAPEFTGLRATPVFPPTTTAKFDLTFEFAELPDRDGIRLRTEFATDLFDTSTVSALVDRVVTALDLLADQPDIALSDIRWAATDEPATPVGAGTATSDSAGPANLAALFNDVAARYPHAVALSDNVLADNTLDDNSSALTYAEVQARATHIARSLVADGVRPGDLVALVLPRSSDLVVAVLGVLQSGAAYVPIDPDYPDERITAILSDASPTCVVDADRLAQILDDPDADSPSGSADIELPSVTRAHPAYVIYTSGSTGTPKGVVVSHGNVLALLTATSELVDVDDSDVWMLFHSYAFDFSVWEMWGPLSTGGHLVVPDRATTRSPEDLAALIDARGVTVLNQTPSAFFALDAADRGDTDDSVNSRFDLASLRLVIFGGEALDLSRLTGFLRRHPQVSPVNMYGITEITVHASYLPIDLNTITRAAGADVGKWLPGFTGTLLDDLLRPVPDGVAGELYLSGPQVATYYLNRPELTATRFVADPSHSGQVMYRTGDLFRRNTDGATLYAGRADTQVKIRGFRIELGEIRSVAAQAPGVRDVAVITRPAPAGGDEILAYVVGGLVVGGLSNGGAIDIDAVRAHLVSQLPEHMVPAAITAVDVIPLTVNGKVDAAALPDPVRRATDSRAPSGEMEVVVAQIFADSLGGSESPAIGADDDFFALGGDSIVSTTMVNRARRRGILFTPRDVFEHRTVAGIAAVAQQIDTSAADSAESVSAAAPTDLTAPISMPITPVMHRLRELGGTINRFNQSLVLDTPIGLNVENLTTALQVVIDSHETLRSTLTVVAGSVWSMQAQPVGTVSAADVLEVVDLDSNADVSAVIATESDRAAGRLDPTSGLMIAATLLNPMAGLRGRLILVIHHLAVDGVSRRILIDDLAVTYAALAAGQPAIPLPEATAWHLFAEAVTARAVDPALLGEAEHWARVLAPGADLVPGMPPVGGTVGEQEELTVTVEPGISAPLLTAVPRELGVGVTSIFLGALQLAATSVLGTGDLLVDTERHGRDLDSSGAGDLDVSHTVGWFTTIAPLRLPAAVDGDPVATIIAADREWNQTPSGGAGFGMLRYVNPQLAPALAQLSRPSVLLNYLGRFSVSGGLDWQPAAESGALAAAPDADLGCDHALEIDIVCRDGRDGPELTATFAYLPTQLRPDTVARLAEAWRACISTITTTIESGVTS